MNKKIKVIIILIPLLILALLGNTLKNSEVTWNPIPKQNLIIGEYYKVSSNYKNGAKSTIEVIRNNNKILKVEYNEIASLQMASRFNQGISKRLSEYNEKFVKENNVSWAKVFIDLEDQIVNNQSFDNLDSIAGCTHSYELSFLPLVKEMKKKLNTRSSYRYYEVTKDFGDGIYGNLKIVTKKDKIISCRYDELFSENKKSILYKDLKRFSKMSKYNSINYSDPSHIGFNVQVDELDKKVFKTQDILDITGLPATLSNKTKGIKRSPTWDNYLTLAKIVEPYLFKN